MDRKKRVKEKASQPVGWPRVCSCIRILDETDAGDEEAIIVGNTGNTELFVLQ